MRALLWAAGGTGFTFLITALGAATVFFFKHCIGERMNRLCLGFAGGVMNAAAVFSLLLPAMEQAPADMAWVVSSVGFAAGAGSMLLLDEALCRSMVSRAGEKRLTMLFSAVTLHNIPEGMAVGLAFAVAAREGSVIPAGACALALGIGIQNFPEGAAISLPLRQSGMGRMKSFLFGVFSGAVEPVFGIAAAWTAGVMLPVLPLMMAFAAGAMMWVVLSEMLPCAAQRRDGALAATVGFLVMMALDVALG